MSTGLRICNRGVRVWSGRFQIFSENFRGDCENCILRNFSGCFFSRQDFFHQDCFKNLRKNLQKFNRISAWLTKLHPLCAEEQFEWFFWRKCNLTIFFEVWIKIFLNCVEKLWARSWNFLLWVQRYKFWSEYKLGFQHMFPDFLFKLIGHMLKLKFTCSKENFENVFSEKTLPVSELQNRSKNVADFCEKSHLGCQNCTARIGKFVLYGKNRSSLSNCELKVLGTSAVDTRQCCVVKTPVNESKTTFLNFFMVEFHSQKYFRTLSETVSDR